MMNWRHFQAQTDKGTLKAVMQLKLLAVCVYRILVIVCHDRNKGENMPNSAMNSTTTVKCRATDDNLLIVNRYLGLSQSNQYRNI